MSKRVSFSAVFVFIIAAFMAAGCAKQDVVKKDAGIAPPPVTKQAAPPESGAATLKQGSATQVVQAAPSPVSSQQPQKASSMAELQGALEKIYFDFDSATLSESSRRTLAGNAAALAKESGAKIRIAGNCDERGSAEYNLALGERRARAAQQYLVTMGVKPESLSIVSYGKEKPAVQGGDEAAWKKNRRDDFLVMTR